MPHIVEGAIVPAGSLTKAFEADFGNIPLLVERDMAEELENYKERLVHDPQRAKLAAALEALPRREGELYTAALGAVTLAQEFFVEEPVDITLRDTTGWTSIDPSRPDSYKIRRLSETAQNGRCTEYSLVVGEIMRRMGQEMEFTAGYRQDEPHKEGIYHAFLSVRDASVIVDPLFIAETTDRPSPLGLMQTGGATIVNIPYGPLAYTDPLGRSIMYSSSPIEAWLQLAA